MKAVFICGGIGKRMRPITKDKTLLSFCGKSLIRHHIETAISVGIEKFLIIANPDNIDDIKTITSALPKIYIDFAVQEKPSGMAGALLSATSLLGKEPIIIINPNDIFEGSAYTNLLNAFNTNDGCSAYITAHKVDTYFPGGYLVTDEHNEIRNIIEKPPKGSEPSNLVNIVIHLHSNPQVLLNYLQKTTSKADDIYEKSIDSMIHDGQKLKAVVYDNAWHAIKYPWHILNTMDYFLHKLTPRIASTARISDKAVIDGPVIIEDNASVFEGAVIRGPSFIGRNTTIGNNALIRESHIGESSVVGFDTEIKHSYIGDKCWFHSNYIGDSIIEDNCSFGAGAVTANLRLDERNIVMTVNGNRIDTETDKLGAMIGTGARIGINASLMPGIRIGSNAFVGPHVYLTRDLDADKMALSPSEYRVLPNENPELDQTKRKKLFDKLGK